MEIDETFGIIAVVPLAIKCTAVAMWRPHVNGVVGLGGLLTVQACCLSRYSHYPPPQPPAQLPQKKKCHWFISFRYREGTFQCAIVHL